MKPDMKETLAPAVEWNQTRSVNYRYCHRRQPDF